VLDCFIGSGTTAIAAIRAGRRYIGIDILQKYVDLARNNIRRELQQISMEI
jgi:DNA modification methylase